LASVGFGWLSNFLVFSIGWLIGWLRLAFKFPCAFHRLASVGGWLAPQFPKIVFKKTNVLSLKSLTSGRLAGWPVGGWPIGRSADGGWLSSGWRLAVGHAIGQLVGWLGLSGWQVVLVGWQLASGRAEPSRT
jgi:hypothetical protein